MVDHDVNNIREAFGSVQAGLSALNAEIRALSDQIDAAQYVTSDAAAQLCAALQDYGAQADHLERLGAELLVPIGGGMAGISEAIRAFEASRSNARMRETLRDYFRLTAAAARTRSALEESKQKLMEKCALCGDRLGEEITPYAMAVDYVRGDEESLSDECYSAIEAALGPALASSVDNRNVRYDETLSTAAYFDGSCPLLAPPDGDSPQGGSNGDGTLADHDGDGAQGDLDGDGAQGDLDGDGAQEGHDGPLNGYGGLIEGASIEFAGNAPASGLQMSAFRLAAAKRKDIPDMAGGGKAPRARSGRQPALPLPVLPGDNRIPRRAGLCHAPENREQSALRRIHSPHRQGLGLLYAHGRAAVHQKRMQPQPDIHPRQGAAAEGSPHDRQRADRRRRGAPCADT